MYADPQKRREHQKKYRREHPEIFRRCRKEYYRKNREAVLARRREYHWNNKNAISARNKRYNDRLKREAMEVLGGIKCVGCGNGDIRTLEVNHIDGIGKGHRFFGAQLYVRILDGRLPREKFNVLCRLCNVLEYIERRYPDLKGKIGVKWKG